MDMVGTLCGGVVILVITLVVGIVIGSVGLLWLASWSMHPPRPPFERGEKIRGLREFYEEAGYGRSGDGAE